jgi:hypothetical protein
LWVIGFGMNMRFYQIKKNPWTSIQGFL